MSLQLRWWIIYVSLIQTPTDTSVRFAGTDIEGYLAHHHDMIILSTIDNAKASFEGDAQEMQQR
jgi:hypothetical protein